MPEVSNFPCKTGLCALWARMLCLSAALLLAAALPGARAAAPWQDLEPGLQLGAFTSNDERRAAIDVLRIDPAFFRFSLHSAGENDGPPLTLPAWAAQENLVLAVNASMYLPDRKTSTGYMRSGAYINNPRIHNRFGAFFVSGPDTAGLPEADVLDRDADPWEELLPHYKVAVQNYRLIDSEGRALWLPGGPEHSTSAVGRDREGRILFIHCRTPMTGREFTDAVLALPVNLRSLMYVEGGSQAGMLVRCSGLERLWLGYTIASFLNMDANLASPLPNILGVTRRADNQ